MTVINTVKTGSDHRLLRAKLTINLLLNVIRIDHEKLVQNRLQYQIELGEQLKRTRYNTVNEAATHIARAVRECAEKVSQLRKLYQSE